MNWWRRVLTRLHPPDTSADAHVQETLDRADVVLKNVDSVQITVVPKNARALAELRRLSGHARR